MDEIESIGTLYVLSIKGGYYNRNGDITDYLSSAQFFPTREGAVEFRKHHDPAHHVDCATLLKLTIFISEEES